MDELVNTKSKSTILEEAMPGATEMNSADSAVVANQCEPIDLFLEQPDGSKVRISFLASGEIVGVPQILAQTYEVVSNAEEPSSSLVQKGSDLISTCVSPEASQHVSAIQTPDGQIYYFDSNPPLKTDKDSLGEAPIFYRLLPKDLNTSVDSEPERQWAEDHQSKEDAKDNVYTNARERLKPFVTVHKTRRRVESKITQIGTDLHLEDKMAARAALLPAPVRVRRGTKRGHHGVQGEARTAQGCNDGNDECTTCGDKCNEECTKCRDKSNEKCGKCDDKCKNRCGEKCSDKCAYRCDMCDASFPRASQYFGHSKAHSKERVLSCSQCTDKVFVAHAQLLQHERACHFSVRAHVCPACSASFERASQLANHRRSFHLKERPNKCGVCEKTFFKHSDLRSHLNIHLGLDAHVCPTCGRRFSHVSNLNRHLRTHTGVRPFPCPTCGRRFAQASGLSLHAETHAIPSESRKVACSVNGCTSLFSSPAARRAHLRARHTDVEPDNQECKPARRARRFHCRVCGLDFPFTVLLKSHEAIHAKQDTFRCSWCQQDLPSMERLKSHSCRTPAQRERDSERIVLAEQMERLLAGSEAEESSSSQDIVIYITHEGREQVVHLKPSTRQDVPLTSQCDLRIASQSDVPITLQSDVPITLQSDVPTTLQSDVPITLESDVPITLQSDVPINLQRDMPIASESDEPIALQKNMPIASERDMPFVSENDKPITSESDVLIASESDVPIASESDVPISSQSCDDAVMPPTDWPKLLNPEPKKEVEGCDQLKEDWICLVDMQQENCSLGQSEIPSGGPNDRVSRAGKITAREAQTKNAAKVKSPPICGTTLIETPPLSKTPPPTVDRKTYHCSAAGCPKTFHKRSNYKQHLGTHYADARSHLCPVCGESFAWRSTLGKHLLKHKPVAQRQRYPCTLCLKTYLFPAQVQNHMRRDHDNERPHTCPSCDKSFFKKHDLTVHLRQHGCHRSTNHEARDAISYHGSRTHTKETPYMCPACGRCFGHASHAARHAALHTGRRPHACPKCGRSFAQAGTLRTHMARQACQP